MHIVLAYLILVFFSACKIIYLIKISIFDVTLLFATILHTAHFKKD